MTPNYISEAADRARDYIGKLEIGRHLGAYDLRNAGVNSYLGWKVLRKLADARLVERVPVECENCSAEASDEDLQDGTCGDCGRGFGYPAPYRSLIGISHEEAEKQSRAYVSELDAKERLTKATPDLLAACEAHEAAFLHYRGCGRCFGESCAAHLELKAKAEYLATAALAKVRGEAVLPVLADEKAGGEKRA